MSKEAVIVTLDEYVKAYRRRCDLRYQFLLVSKRVKKIDAPFDEVKDWAIAGPNLSPNR